MRQTKKATRISSTWDICVCFFFFAFVWIYLSLLKIRSIFMHNRNAISSPHTFNTFFEVLDFLCPFLHPWSKAFCTLLRLAGTSPPAMASSSWPPFPQVRTWGAESWGSGFIPRPSCWAPWLCFSTWDDSSLRGGSTFLPVMDLEFWCPLLRASFLI